MHFPSQLSKIINPELLTVVIMVMLSAGSRQEQLLLGLGHGRDTVGERARRDHWCSGEVTVIQSLCLPRTDSPCRISCLVVLCFAVISGSGHVIRKI